MSDPVTADGIRENIKAALTQLEILKAQGRVVMTRDPYNRDWPDTATALTAAIDGLERAVDAMHWMETLPHTDGGYPPLTTTS